MESPQLFPLVNPPAKAKLMEKRGETSRNRMVKTWWSSKKASAQENEQQCGKLQMEFHEIGDDRAADE